MRLANALKLAAAGSIALCACAAFAKSEAAQALPRRLDFGWSLGDVETAAAGALVRHVRPGGPADRAGLRAGDRILQVGDVILDSGSARASLRTVEPDSTVQAAVVRFQRGTERATAKLSLEPAARESHRGIDTEWGAVEGPGGLRLRTIVTAPSGVQTLAAVFIVGWLSCDSVEIPVGHPDPTAQLIGDIVENSGAAVLRVEKPGVGDSDGVCAATDFATELQGYQRGFEQLRRHPRVDPQRIVIVGISNGGGFAPLVAGDAPVAAYVTVGGWSKTWYEHMLDLERRRLVLSGMAPSAIGPAMAALCEFHASYLFEQLTPGEVIRRKPHLRGLWYDEPDSQYGRPAAFYHQLQRLDLAAAWGRVRAPALVVWGEFDWIMDRADQEQIVRLVNGDGVVRASLLAVPGMDHNFGRYPDRQPAFDHRVEGSYASDAGRQIVEFIRKSGSVAR